MRELRTSLLILSLVACNRLLQPCQFGLQLCGFVDRWLRRHKGARSVVDVFEGAMEPKRELPAKFECGQGSSMIAGQGMVRSVAIDADLIEDLFYFSGQGALVL